MSTMIATRKAPIEVVSTENMPEKEWLDWRRKGIGGSEVATLMGLSPFMTARDLYQDKGGEAKEDGNLDDKLLCQ